MKEIKLFEKAIKQNIKNLKEFGINRALFFAYITSKENGNELINFNNVIWDFDVEEIAQTLKANDIAEFTISNAAFSNFIEILAVFEKHGIIMAGLTTIKARYIDFKTGKRALIPAIKMVIN